MKTIQVKCLNCGNIFNAQIKEINRGFGKFCSRACFGEFNGKKLAAAVLPKKITYTCACCGKKFLDNKDRAKKSKSGLYFCCRECKDKAQRLGGIKEIMPPHYGTGDGTHDYRKRAIDQYGYKCSNSNCELTLKGIKISKKMLDVHHKDGNRNNNNLENLEVLCVWCHALKTRTKWKN